MPTVPSAHPTNFPSGIPWVQDKIMRTPTTSLLPPPHRLAILEISAEVAGEEHHGDGGGCYARKIHPVVAASSPTRPKNLPLPLSPTGSRLHGTGTGIHRSPSPPFLFSGQRGQWGAARLRRARWGAACLISLASSKGRCRAAAKSNGRRAARSCIGLLVLGEEGGAGPLIWGDVFFCPHCLWAWHNFVPGRSAIRCCTAGEIFYFQVFSYFSV